jgi:hypothetical protein
LTYEAFEFDKSFDFVSAQLQGLDLGKRTQVGKLFASQVVVCQHDLSLLYAKRVLTRVSLGQLGKFSRELRRQLVIESVSIAVNFSRYSLSGFVSLSIDVSSRISLSY